MERPTDARNNTGTILSFVPARLPVFIPWTSVPSLHSPLAQLLVSLRSAIHLIITVLRETRTLHEEEETRKEATPREFFS